MATDEPERVSLLLADIDSGEVVNTRQRGPAFVPTRGASPSTGVTPSNSPRRRLVHRGRQAQRSEGNREPRARSMERKRSQNKLADTMQRLNQSEGAGVIHAGGVVAVEKPKSRSSQRSKLSGGTRTSYGRMDGSSPASRIRAGKSLFGGRGATSLLPASSDEEGFSDSSGYGDGDSDDGDSAIYSARGDPDVRQQRTTVIDCRATNNDGMPRRGSRGGSRTRPPTVDSTELGSTPASPHNGSAQSLDRGSPLFDELPLVAPEFKASGVARDVPTVDDPVFDAAQRQRAQRMLQRRQFSTADSRAMYTVYDDMYETYLAQHTHVFGERTKVALCVTLFNEEEEELRRTMEGIAQNVAQLKVEQDEIVICLVADGRVNVTQSLIDYADALHILNADELAAATQAVESGLSSPGVHLFEHPFVATYEGAPLEQSMQVVFCIKEKNAGKLSSHRWFFDALCKKVNPEVVYLIDAGTQPKSGSLEALRRNFQDFPTLGGCCGELKVYQPQCLQLVNSAQQFEYKMSHILDKAMESVFGFVTVLPGAFSAYRYSAIQGAPLDRYFHCEHNHVTSPFMSNMYLAEDRILGFEVLVKQGCNWHLSYVYDSVADTDVPTSIVALVKQRRRWLNGAFFTLLYFLGNWWRLMLHTRHSLIRKLGFLVQLVYMLVNLAIYWFTLGNMFLSFYIVMSITVTDERVFGIMQIAYTSILLGQFVIALGTKAGDMKWIYHIFSAVHGLIMVGILASLFVYLAHTASLEIMFLLGTAGIASYALVTVLYGETCFILSNAVQYVFMVPTFMSVIMVFSFCNIHDVSWGTREAKSAATKTDPAVQAAMMKKQRKQEARMRRARALLVSAWLVSNWLFAAIFVDLEITQKYAIGVVLAYGAMLGFRLVGSIIYRVHMLLYHCCRKGGSSHTVRAPRSAPSGSWVSGKPTASWTAAGLKYKLDVSAKKGGAMHGLGMDVQELDDDDISDSDGDDSLGSGERLHDHRPASAAQRRHMRPASAGRRNGSMSRVHPVVASDRGRASSRRGLKARPGSRSSALV